MPTWAGLDGTGLTNHSQAERMTRVEVDQVTKLARVRSLAESGAARHIRRSARISLPEAAGAIGVAISTLHRWEVGERKPTGPRALKYDDFLDALLNGGRMKG
jgi:DNA-binding transcriptional regulator YiaG